MLRRTGVTCVLVAAVVAASANLSWAQEGGQIGGTITLANTGEPLHGVRVLIVELARTTLTDEHGRYDFAAVPRGSYAVVAVREHLQAARTVAEVVSGKPTGIDFVLQLASVHEEITVTATGRETTTFDAFNTVDVLDSVELAQKMSGSLGELLAGEPNVAKRSFGPGSSRPIIRGFDGDRVLIMQDGIRTGDLSSQSGDHGTTIDPASLDRVEILKGPATLLYGSNAIGGVVNTLSPQRQFYTRPPRELRGQVTGDLGSANGQAGANGNFQYGNGRFMLWFGGGTRRTGDYRTPLGPVANSASDSANARIGGGWFGEHGWLSGSYQVENGSYGIPDPSAQATAAAGVHRIALTATSAGEEPESSLAISTNREAFRLDTGLRGLAGLVESLEATFNYVGYDQQEIESDPDSGETEVGTAFVNNSFIGRIEARQRVSGASSGQFGIWGKVRNYTSSGVEALAPDTRQTAFAAFVYEELTFESVSLQLGTRWERTAYRPTGHTVSNPGAEAVARSFAGISASFGLRVPLVGGAAALVASASSSYRAPALEELYNFGAHPGNLAFEIGNSGLRRERSNGGEISLRYNGQRAHGDFNAFYYDITDFVFASPTGAIRDSLVEVLFAQQSARFVGFDMKWQLHLDPRLQLQLGGGLVNARFTDSRQWVPRIPPASARLAVDWTPVDRLQLRPELTVAARQARTFGAETPTDGYAVLDLLASYTLARAKAMQVITLRVSNVGNALVRNHSSFIKEFAPEIGRRLLMTYTLRLF